MRAYAQTSRNAAERQTAVLHVISVACVRVADNEGVVDNDLEEGVHVRAFVPHVRDVGKEKHRLATVHLERRLHGKLGQRSPRGRRARGLHVRREVDRRAQRGRGLGECREPNVTPSVIIVRTHVEDIHIKLGLQNKQSAGTRQEIVSTAGIFETVSRTAVFHLELYLCCVHADAQIRSDTMEGDRVKVPNSRVTGVPIGDHPGAVDDDAKVCVLIHRRTLHVRHICKEHHHVTLGDLESHTFFTPRQCAPIGSLHASGTGKFADARGQL